MEPTTPQYATVEEYIRAFPSEVQERLQTLRKLVKELSPEAEEAIKYGMPTFVVNGRNALHMAAFKRHISLYGSTKEMEAAVEGLAAHASGRGTLQFPNDEPLPLPLIKRAVEARIKERDSAY